MSHVSVARRCTAEVVSRQHTFVCTLVSLRDHTLTHPHIYSRVVLDVPHAHAMDLLHHATWAGDNDIMGYWFYGEHLSDTAR